MEEGAILDGLGIRRQYRMWFREDKSGPVIDWIAFIPNRIQGMSAKKSGKAPVCENAEKVPVILSLNYRGNEAVHVDNIFVGEEDVSTTLTGLKPDTDYWFKVRSYVQLPDGTRYYGQQSEAVHTKTLK